MIKRCDWTVLRLTTRPRPARYDWTCQKLPPTGIAQGVIGVDKPPYHDKVKVHKKVWNGIGAPEYQMLNRSIKWHSKIDALRLYLLSFLYELMTCFRLCLSMLLFFISLADGIKITYELVPKYLSREQSKHH